jgi:hypothetical protein
MVKRFLVLALALVVSLQPVVLRTARAQAPARCDGCALIEEALKAAQTLTPGTPRSKVEMDFRPDGGLQPFYGPSRYLFKKCPSIKIEIEFTHFDGQQDGLPSDQVIKVSRPYLEYPFYD